MQKGGISSIYHKIYTNLYKKYTPADNGYKEGNKGREHFASNHPPIPGIAEENSQSRLLTFI
jgi:hypothetical protein